MPANFNIESRTDISVMVTIFDPNTGYIEYIPCKKKDLTFSFREDPTHPKGYYGYVFFRGIKIWDFSQQSSDYANYIDGMDDIPTIYDYLANTFFKYID